MNTLGYAGDGRDLPSRLNLTSPLAPVPLLTYRGRVTSGTQSDIVRTWQSIREKVRSIKRAHFTWDHFCPAWPLVGCP